MKTKDAGLRLRVERELRDEFVELCRGSGRPAAQVLRDFMRAYIERNRAVAQPDLFNAPTTAADR
jgi:hypothetical protein